MVCSGTRAECEDEDRWLKCDKRGEERARVSVGDGIGRLESIICGWCVQQIFMEAKEGCATCWRRFRDDQDF